MSEPKFTPGPWEAKVVSAFKVLINPNITTMPRYATVESDVDQEVGVRPIAEQEANAHLIAAAPDLYAMARMHKSYEAHKETCANAPCVVCTQYEMSIRAGRDTALAKARGEAGS